MFDVHVHAYVIILHKHVCLCNIILNMYMYMSYYVWIIHTLLLYDYYSPCVTADVSNEDEYINYTVTLFGTHINAHNINNCRT